MSGSLAPHVQPLSQTSESFGGPPPDINRFVFNTPWGLQNFQATYQGPRINGTPTQTPTTIRSLSRTRGLGLLDRFLERLGLQG